MLKAILDIPAGQRLSDCARETMLSSRKRHRSSCQHSGKTALIWIRWTITYWSIRDINHLMPQLIKEWQKFDGWPEFHWLSSQSVARTSEVMYSRMRRTFRNMISDKWSASCRQTACHWSYATLINLLCWKLYIFSGIFLTLMKLTLSLYFSNRICNVLLTCIRVLTCKLSDKIDKVFGELLQFIPLTSFYPDTMLIVQWLLDMTSDSESRRPFRALCGNATPTPQCNK